MSTIKDALDAVREVLKLVDDMKRTTARIGDLASEVREMDRRVSRLEGKWEAAMDFGRANVGRSAPRSLPNKPKKGGDQ